MVGCMTYSPLHRANPTSITVTAGGTPVGTVANVETMLDGDVYQIPELAADPGFDVRFNFTGLSFLPDAIVSRTWYDGAHLVQLELWDYVGSAFVVIDQIIPTDSYIIVETVVQPEERFVSSGAAIVRYHHNQQGIAAHDIYWDYVSLWHRPFPPIKLYA